MGRPSHSDDQELRALLDSLGMRSTADLPENEGTRRRAEQELQRLVNRPAPPSPPRLRRRPAVVGVAVAAACASIFIPLSLRHHATAPDQSSLAQPVPLHFATPPQPGHDDVVTRGSLSASILDRLSFLASQQHVVHSARPVQEIRTYVWNGTGPVLARATYVFDGHRFESIGPNVSVNGVGTIESVTTDEHIGPARLQPSKVEDPTRLPVGRPALLRHLLASASCKATDTACALTEVARLFSTYALTPRTAGALWHAVARLHAITDLGATHDRLGRLAVGLSTPMGKEQQLILLADPKTGALLGTEVVARIDASKTRVLAFTVIRATAHIEALPTH